MELPTKEALARIELSRDDRDLICHFANNALAVILANSSYLSDMAHLIHCGDPAVQKDVRECAADLRDAAEELAQVIRLLGASTLARGPLAREAVGEVDDDDGSGEGSDLDPVPVPVPHS